MNALDAYIVGIGREQSAKTVKALRRRSNPYSVASNLHQSSGQPIDHARQEGEAAAGKKVDCKASCSWCCYQPVEVSADEVLLVGRHIEQITEELRKEIWEKVSKTAMIVQSLPNRSRASVSKEGIACPVLGKEGTCVVYLARPTLCRGNDSFSASDCKQIVQNPDFTGTFTKARFAAQGASLGHAMALEDRGYDGRRYDLTLALNELHASGIDRAAASWIEKKQVFDDRALTLED
ncbi:YkgJ family cysteine cluster protein [Roseomonas sp. ACRSG]|nr:YkgJ family cysteine cluster protein [Roseomonas sp. ACRSG]